MNATTSVIIACNNAEAVIGECLTRLLQQGHHDVLEIIVAEGSTDSTAQLIETQFPTVKLLHFDHPTTLPLLRGRAIEHATGQIIVILDPFSMVSPGWLEQLQRVHAEQDHTVIGGAVDLYQSDQQGLCVWAQYFNEYGMFMTPIEEGSTDILPGCNISYKREALFDGDRPRSAEFWKTFVNAGVQQTGSPLWLSPAFRVDLWKPVGFGNFLLTRFTHGRCYAGMRCADSGPAERLLRLLSSPLVPFVLQYRWSKSIWRKKKSQAQVCLEPAIAVHVVHVLVGGRICRLPQRTRQKLQEALLLMNAHLSDRLTEPALSVIVVSFNHAEQLDQCLAALMSQPDAGQIEIRVISKKARFDVLLDAWQFPQIHWHQVGSNQTIPEMRSTGMRQSKAKLLALIEDDCMVGPEWLQAILSAHESEHVAVGGAIEPGDYQRGLDWGIFYCEFGRFLSPFSGVVNALPGNNVCYRASAIDPALLKQGFYEVFVHEKWQQSGIELLASPGMVVKNNNTWNFAQCSISPFHHGRVYAGQRFGRGFGARRLLYGLLTPLLPPLKSFRTFRQVRSRKRADLPLVKALPWVVLFHVCWSAGELIGYWTGVGNSTEKWG